jgi:hypothetical protein
MFPIAPAPFPDECARSYGFRVFTANHLAPNSILKLLPRLTEATGLDFLKLVLHHSHTTYHRFVRDKFAFQDITSHDDLYGNSQINSAKIPTTTGRYCKKCINEDIGFHGISYWRRIHHLPGVEHCIKHQEPLCTTEGSNLYSSYPQDATPLKNSLRKDRFKTYFKSAAIDRFATLSMAALDSRVPFKHSIMAHVLRKRNLEIHSQRNRSIYDTAIKQCPRSWIARSFPEIRPNYKAYVERVVSHVGCNIPPKFYLLAMSVLWDDPNEALSTCINEHRNSPSGFNETSGRKAIFDFQYGYSIYDACIKNAIHVRDFEFILRRLMNGSESVHKQKWTRIDSIRY